LIVFPSAVNNGGFGISKEDMLKTVYPPFSVVYSLMILPESYLHLVFSL